jgi:hypothetical protein
MSTQLQRLADRLHDYSWVSHKASTELRRLDAENARLTEQRDALLEALKELVEIASVLEPTCLGDSRAKENRMDRARAAIVAATQS